jgi:four helix bundle protein
VYHATRSLPPQERYGLQAQLRRAAVSVPTNIVEGCARRKETEYGHYINIAIGSAAETSYLISVVRRLRMYDETRCQELEDEYETLSSELLKLLSAIEVFE